MLKVLAASALGAFILSGPLQHIGALPETAIGNASKAAIKLVLDTTSQPAFAGCRGGGGGYKGNNGFGNGGFDGVPGNSGNNKSPNAGQKKNDRAR